jgi:hypothetical protein
MKTTELPMDPAVYGHPKVYANSENIPPPVEKERVRVVEQATRAEIKLDQQVAVEDRLREIKELRQQAAARYGSDGKSVISPGETQAQFVDVEV